MKKTIEADDNILFPVEPVIQLPQLCMRFLRGFYVGAILGHQPNSMANLFKI